MGQSCCFSEFGHQRHWKVVNKPIFMRHLSVSPAPNLRKTTWLPKSDLTSLDTNSVGPNCLWLKDTCEKSCVAYIHPLIVQFRFHHFATFEIMNATEQHCCKIQTLWTEPQCTVFRKASILSGSGFNKFLASQNFFRENAMD